MSRLKIRRISSRIAVLERRATYLDGRVKRGGGKDLSFDVSELGALKSAIKALRLVELMQRPETDPVMALSELHDAVSELDTNAQARDQEQARGRLAEAMGRAQAVIGMAERALEDEDDEEDAA